VLLSGNVCIYVNFVCIIPLFCSLLPVISLTRVPVGVNTPVAAVTPLVLTEFRRGANRVPTRAVSLSYAWGLRTPLEGVRASNPFSSCAGGWRWRGEFSASLGFANN
jgi:hypothetical protein